MADAKTIKTELGITKRGQLARTVIDEWNTAHPGDPYEAGPPREANGHAPDYPADDFEDMFPDAAVSPADSPAETLAETPPRRAKPKSAPRGGVRGLFAGKGKPKSKHKRVSTEDLLGSLWRGAAKLAAPMPPLQRTLRVQAPVAGLLLEDAVRDTVVDPLLQPLARMAEAGKTVQALVGPPAFVTAITLHAAQRAALDPPQGPHPMFMAVATEGLRSSLMAWCDVAGPKFEIALAKEREFEDRYGQKVDDMMNWIFGMPVDPMDEEAMAAEEDAIRRAQGIL
jgi:hypothetical protein